MTQYDIILDAMLNNPNKQWWSAKDFQRGEHFVGYEATARISELVKKYPTLFIVGKDGRFRIIAIDWSSNDLEFHKKRLNDIKKIKIEMEG